MSAEYDIESYAALQNLVPQQDVLYRNQLRSIADLTLHGVGFDVGVGSSARQYYLRLGGEVGQNVTSLAWQSSTESGAVNFAVLPPREGARNYFGIVSPADHDEEKLWVEGVDLRPTGGGYGKLLVGYDSMMDRGRKIPIAIGAFVNTMRGQMVSPVQEANETLIVGLNHETHQKLGAAILSFWQTLSMPPRLSIEHASSKSAFDLANLILVSELRRISQGGNDSRFDTVRPHMDARGNIAGFVGKDNRSNSILALVRNNAVYPERIDYIQIPLSPKAEDDSVVSHYAIASSSISTRICIVSPALVKDENISDLVRTIQLNRQPHERVGGELLDDVVRELHAELGRLIQPD
ncbi:MAG: hypothetical protein ABWX94_01305 [Candidatus Saccharimonadales bacterium]